MIRWLLALQIALLSFPVIIAQNVYSGESQYAMRFNYSQYLTLPVALNAELGKSFTFEAWIKLPMADTVNNYNGEPGDWGGLGLTQLNRPIVSRFRTDLASPPNQENDFDFQINPEGELQLFVGGSGSGGSALGIFVRSKTVPLVDNRWYHVAFTIEYSNLNNNFPDGAHLYLDYEDVTGHIVESPVPFNQWQLGLQRAPLQSEAINIGHYNSDDEFWPTGHYFLGDMDEIRFWTGVRTAEELTDATLAYENRTVRAGRVEPWHHPPGSTAATLVAEYNFNERNAIPGMVQDNGPDGFHATIHQNPERIYPAEWIASPLFVFSLEYAYQWKPIIIDLHGLDTNGLTNVSYYELTWDSANVNGMLYQYDLAGPNSEPRLFNSFHWGAAYPTGTIQIPASVGKVVFQWNEVLSPFFNGEYDLYYFEYRAVTADGRVSSDSYISDIYPTGANTPVYLFLYPCTMDGCGVCDGNNATLDDCQVCGGNNLNKDVCGVCFGDGSSCIGCDGKPGGLKIDICGVCGGNNGSCIGCDGSGGGVLDACGVCNGKNDTCGGCDSKGGDYDYCGVCAGDNSTCTCVRYKGYDIEVMEVILLEWSLNHTIFTLDCLIDLIHILEKQQVYPVDFDFAALIEFLCKFLREDIEPFNELLDEFLKAVDAAFGPKPGMGRDFNYTEVPWPVQQTIPIYQQTEITQNCEAVESP